MFDDLGRCSSFGSAILNGQMSINYWTKGGVSLGAGSSFGGAYFMDEMSINWTLGGVYLGAPLKKLLICGWRCLFDEKSIKKELTAS